MIHDTDWAIVALIAFLVALATLAVSTAYYAARVDDIRLRCQERIAQANAEVAAARDMVRRTEVQRRILGSVPVSRLIGDDDDAR